MELLVVFIGKVMPYITLAVLIVGLVTKLWRWNRGAVANIALYPSAGNPVQKLKQVLGEVVLFSSFRKQDKPLWRRTWIFHATLVLILAGHSRLITDWPLRVGLGLSEETVHNLSFWGGGICGVLALVTCTLLLTRRFAIKRVREISSGEDYSVLILLLFILITGNAMRFLGHFDITQTQIYFQSLFTSAPVLVPRDPMFLLHFMLVQILLIYMPFGKFLHIPGIFYSRSLLAKDY